MKNNLTKKALLSGISRALKHQTSVNSKLMISIYKHTKKHTQIAHPFLFGEQSPFKIFKKTKFTNRNGFSFYC